MTGWSICKSSLWRSSSCWKSLGIEVKLENKEKENSGSFDAHQANVEKLCVYHQGRWTRGKQSPLRNLYCCPTLPLSNVSEGYHFSSFCVCVCVCAGLIMFKWSHYIYCMYIKYIYLYFKNIFYPIQYGSIIFYTYILRKHNRWNLTTSQVETGYRNMAYTLWKNLKMFLGNCAVYTVQWHLQNKSGSLNTLGCGKLCHPVF